jgi:hypothetical protein
VLSRFTVTTQRGFLLPKHVGRHFESLSLEVYGKNLAAAENCGGRERKHSVIGHSGGINAGL